ncbi:uncharacterized protein LOC131332660 [Rhododendron vialii]|uniref:uncharacterized protein LOC131332660 n=1 Tax=Rhododendron vialii TaxID=182163 RepID=UPI00265E815D|nr:uncharacterized protein LOC131332660 [Rhododendron vialii]
MVGSIKVNDRVLEDPMEIKAAAIDYFSDNFKEERKLRPMLGGELPRVLNQATSSQLNEVFEEGKSLRNCYCNSSLSSTPVASSLEALNLYNFNSEGWVYKVLAKVLANRLKCHLPPLIGESQAAFIKGKQILDGVLIANEVIHRWKNSFQGGLILKIDFEKAYDCVNWGFLLDLSTKLGFGEKWAQHLLERARDLNIIKGARVGLNGAIGILVSHLQFADDTIIFCNNDREELANIKRILRCFQLMSGLKINYSKSSLCGIKVSHQDVTSLAMIMGCKIDHLPIKYLGLPLEANPKRIKTWDPVVERMEKRLRN